MTQKTIYEHAVQESSFIKNSIYRIVESLHKRTVMIIEKRRERLEHFI